MATKRKKTSHGNGNHADFLAGLQLYGLALKSCNVALDRQAYWDSAQKEKKPTRRLNEHYRVSAVKDDFFESEGLFNLVLGEEERPGLKIDCVFEVHIHTKTPINRESVERFTSSELRLLLLPYVRHFISSITSQMQIPTIVLPLAVGAARHAAGRFGE